MAFHEVYRHQAVLLVRTLPLVAEETCFAMKGGTAINLFVRDLPRLSVDIDLTYLPVQARADSLAHIDAAMKRIGDRIRTVMPGVRVTGSPSMEGIVTKLVIRSDAVQIKIEVTPVLRGSVFESETRTVTPAVEAEFGFAGMQIVSFADLYGGKLVAALDRQHPRDLFDVMHLLENEGIQDVVRQAFLVYLLSHNRPMAEVLSATPKDIEPEFNRGFVGMTRESVSLAALLATREAMIADLVRRMPDVHRQLLVSFERGTPDWSLLGVEKAPDLPAVKWRQRNLDSLRPDVRADLVAKLERVLSET